MTYYTQTGGIYPMQKPCETWYNHSIIHDREMRIIRQMIHYPQMSGNRIFHKYDLENDKFTKCYNRISPHSKYHMHNGLRKKKGYVHKPR